MIKEVTLPSGKTLNIKFKAMDSVEKINYLLFGAYNDVHIPNTLLLENVINAVAI